MPEVDLEYESYWYNTADYYPGTFQFKFKYSNLSLIYAWESGAHAEQQENIFQHYRFELKILKIQFKL